MLQYIEIKLLPDPEFPPTVLMNALYGKFHRLLTELNTSKVGVSFPDVEKMPHTLGLRMRLHGDNEILQRVNDSDWLKGMRDHCAISSIQDVPSNCKHKVVRRVQVKSNPERLRRRMAKRKGISIEMATATIPDNVARQLELPFIKIKSRSTKQDFPLFIEHSSSKDEPAYGNFNAYGLSQNGATVPWF